MIEVKHFVGGTTRNALKFLDDEIKNWFRESGVTQVLQMNETFGQAPTGMGGSMENSLFIAIWYRAGEAVKNETS